MQITPGDVAQKVMASLLLGVSVGGPVGDVRGLGSVRFASVKGRSTCDWSGGLLFCPPV